MRFPRLLIVQAFAGLPLIALCAIAGYKAVMAYYGYGDLKWLWLNTADAVLVFSLCVSCLTGICSTAASFLRSKYSYAVLLVHAVAVSVLNIIWVSDLFAGGMDMEDGVWSAILSVYSGWLFFLLIRPRHVRWFRARGGMFRVMFNLRILIPFIACVSLIMIIPHIVQKIGYDEEIVLGVSVSASCVDNGKTDHGIRNAYDGSLETFWAPGYGDGIDQWIRMDLDNADSLPVSEIRIVSDYSGKYGRARNVLVETSDGSAFTFQLKNTPEEQSIPVKEKNYKWIRLVIKSVYPGVRNSISVSEISLHGKLHEKGRLGSPD